MNKDIFIHSFHPVLPQHHLRQAEIVDWILKSHLISDVLTGSGESEKIEHDLKRFALSEKYIAERYFECGEVDENWENHRIYKFSGDSPLGAPLEERNLVFGEKTKHVFDELYHDRHPDHVIHVTCTGYLSPSPVQSFFSKDEHSPEITHAYHMGCYASLPAVRMGVGLALSEEKEIDIVHTEICSLHLRPEVNTPEQMVVQSLFADGHIRYIVSDEKKGMKILCVHEKIVPDTEAYMTWIPSSHGMSMTLSREVPIKIRDSLEGFIRELCEKAHVNVGDILKEGIFAIHPGGPKIIEAVQKKLGLNDEQVKESKKVLLERGNMSSATLPHVWNEILNANPEKGRKVLSLAFGPGLTIFGSLFEVAS
jgi:predicted naringenin-chalcone synthase